jgi:hypothetical protein
MSPFRSAIALTRQAREAGLDLGLDGERFELLGVPPGPFLAQLDVLFSFAPIEDAEALAARIARGAAEPCTVEDLYTMRQRARDALPFYRALRALLRAPSEAVREVLMLSVAHARLPLAYAVTIARGGASSVFTTSRRIYDREVGRRPLWRLPELDLLARTLEAGRASGRLFDGWLAAKRRGEWYLSPAVADIRGDTPDPQCTFGELVDGFDAEITGLEWEVAA